MKLSNRIQELRKSVCKNDHDRMILDQVAKIIRLRDGDIIIKTEESLDALINKFKLITLIKDTALNLLGQYMKEPDYLTIIRWFYTQKLYDDSSDPILPYNTRANEGIHYELRRRKVPSSFIKHFENLLHQMVKSFGQFPDPFDYENIEDPKIIKKKDKLNRSGPQPRLLVEYISNLNYVLFTYQKFTQKITTKSYIKLLNDYGRTNGHLTMKFDQFQSIPNINAIDPIINERIFRLICRYQSLPGPGYHASIPLQSFDLLRDWLGVRHELFASPLNHTLDEYTSNYPDVDTYFGSKGNFFTEYPKLFEKGGSFEANPPFLEEHMAALALIIVDALETYQVPLSFVIIIPAWIDTVCYYTLIQSKFNVLIDKYLSLERHKHYYRNGSEYLLDDGSRKSNNKTLIFILQNKQGQREYPVTNEFIEKLLLSFNQC